MKPKDFDKWYGKSFERISKPKTDEQLRSILIQATLATYAVSYSVNFN